jgi:hypothetical protein
VGLMVVLLAMVEEAPAWVLLATGVQLVETLVNVGGMMRRDSSFSMLASHAFDALGCTL